MGSTKNIEYRDCYFQTFKELLSQGGNTDGPIKTIESGKLINLDIDKSIIQNALFEYDVGFDNIRFNNKITFKDCIFKSNVQFVDVSFNSIIVFEDCSGVGNIDFINCAFNDFQIVSGSYESIRFIGTTRESIFGLNSVKFNLCSLKKLEIKSKELHTSIEFNGGNVDDLFISRSRLYRSLLFINNFYCKSFIAETSEFNARLDFYDSNFGNVYLRKASFNEQLVFRKEFKCRSLSFSNTYSKRSIAISFCNDNIASLDIGDCNAEGNLTLSGELNKDLKVAQCISLSLSGTFHGFMSISNIPVFANIDAINFGTIHFDNFRPKILTFQNFHNYGKLVLSNLHLHKDYNCLIIYDSCIRSTEFINADFREFDEVVIAKSNVSELVLSNSLLPSEISTETKNQNLGYKIQSINKITDNIYKQENYRQLRIAMESQGNRKEALHYKSLEMDCLRKELPFGWDKVLLFLNFLSNKHGLSWTRGVLFTILSALFFFLLYENTLQNPHFYWTFDSSLLISKDAFFNGTRYFLKYLSSFPSLRFEQDTDSAAANFITVFARIFIGYGIFQTISAFRKFGAK